MNRILMTVAAAALIGAGGVSWAQEDAVNPAPKYAPTPAVQNHQVKHIEDGINSAPRYPTVAPVHSTNTTPIQDANNPAPIVQSATTTAQASQTRRARTTAKAAGTQHARHHTRSASHS
jgi:hypothetical protein